MGKALKSDRKKRFFKSISHGLNVPAKASAASALSNVVSKAAALLFTPFFTRLMPPEEYGRYSLFYSYLSALMIFSTLEITGSVYFKASRKFSGERQGLEGKAFLLILVCSSVTFAAFLAASKIFGIEEPFPGAYPLLLISVISSAAVNLKVSGYKYSYKYKTPFLITVLQSVISPLLALTLLRLVKNESSRVFFKVAVATGVSLVIALPIIIGILFRSRRFGETGCRGAIPYLLKLALPMLPYYISLLIISSADRIIIGNVLGASELGKYAVGYSAGIAVGGVVSGAAQALLPWLTRRIEYRDFSKIRRLTLSAQRIIISVSLIFMALAPEIIGFLAPASYRGALFILYPAAASALPLFLISIHVCALVCYEKSFFVGGASAVCAAFNLLSNALLIGRYGIGASAITTFISYMLLFVIICVIFRLVSGEKLLVVSKTARDTLLFITFAAALFSFRNSLTVRLGAAVILALLCATELYRSKSLFKEEGKKSIA